MAFACWLDSHLTASSSGSTFAVPQLMLGLGQAWSMLFLNMATVASVKPSDAADAAGLFNTARNFGGSVALALLATLQDRRLDYHHWTINSALSANDPSVQNWVSQQSAALGGGSDGMDAAFRMIDMMVMRDALVMAYNDNFVIFMVAIIVLLPLVLLLRPLPKGHHNQMAAH